MRVLGIDCGVARTGYGIIDLRGGRTPSLVASGVIATSSKEDFPRRLSSFYGRLKAVIEKFAPEQVAIEDLFYSRNFRTTFKLGHVRAVAMLAAAGAGLPVAEYSPLEVKSSMVGYGRAEKFQVQDMVKRILVLAEAPRSLDACDALAVALCHAHTVETRSRMGLGANDSGIRRRKSKPFRAPVRR